MKTQVASRFHSPFFATFWMATRLTFSPAEKISARSPRDGPRSARLQSRTPAKDKPGRQSFRESPSAVRTAERLAKPAEPQTALPAAVLSEPTEAETSAQAGEANAMAAEVSRHEEEVLTAARKWPLGGGSSAAGILRPTRWALCSLRAQEDSPSRSELQSRRMAPPPAHASA